jgi:hypothetical protein
VVDKKKQKKPRLLAEYLQGAAPTHSDKLNYLLWCIEASLDRENKLLKEMLLDLD